MMGKLIFKAADVRRVVEHTLTAPKQRDVLIDFDAEGNGIYSSASAPSVILVHDDGVYLMSNGEPRDLVEADGEFGVQATTPGEPTKRSYVAHAKGCDPRKDNDWWDTSHDLVGGDDFAETLPWAKQIADAIKGGVREIVVNYGDRHVSLSFRK